MITDTKTLIDEAWACLREAGKVDPQERFRRLVEIGLIDSEGRLVQMRLPSTDLTPDRPGYTPGIDR